MRDASHCITLCNLRSPCSFPGAIGISRGGPPSVDFISVFVSNNADAVFEVDTDVDDAIVASESKHTLTLLCNSIDLL